MRKGKKNLRLIELVWRRFCRKICKFDQCQTFFFVFFFLLPCHFSLFSFFLYLIPCSNFSCLRAYIRWMLNMNFAIFSARLHRQPTQRAHTHKHCAFAFLRTFSFKDPDSPIFILYRRYVFARKLNQLTEARERRFITIVVISMVRRQRRNIKCHYFTMSANRQDPAK